jgi:hypothetical protein
MLSTSLPYVVQAMEKCGHAENKLWNRTYFISLWWKIRNFSILTRARSAGQKAQPVSSEKNASLQAPDENESLSKLKFMT